MKTNRIKRVTYRILFCLVITIALLLSFFDTSLKAENLKITEEIVKVGIGPRSYVENAVCNLVGIYFDIIGESEKEPPFMETMKAKIAIEFFNRQAMLVLPDYYVKLLPKPNSFFSSTRQAFINLKTIEYVLESQIAHFVPFDEKDMNLDYRARRKRINEMKKVLERLELP